jgi:hypothetical protein
MIEKLQIIWTLFVWRLVRRFSSNVRIDTTRYVPGSIPTWAEWSGSSWVARQERYLKSTAVNSSLVRLHLSLPPRWPVETESERDAIDHYGRWMSETIWMPPLLDKSGFTAEKVLQYLIWYLAVASLLLIGSVALIFLFGSLACIGFQVYFYLRYGTWFDLPATVAWSYFYDFSPHFEWKGVQALIVEFLGLPLSVCLFAFSVAAACMLMVVSNFTGKLRDEIESRD